VTRTLSLLLSLVASAVLTVAPFLIARQMTPAAHAILPFLLLGISAGFVHGLGYSPRLLFMRALASPMCAWPLIVGSLFLLTIR